MTSQPSRQPDLGAAVADEITREVAARLDRPRTPLAVLQLAEKAVSLASHRAADSPLKPQQACRAGCAWCCHMAVSVTPLEALWIAERLRATRTASELSALSARVRETARKVSHLTIEQRAKVRVACALLDRDGVCGIHPFRPVGCRGWTSLDASACERAFESDQPGHSEAMDGVAWLVANAVTEGLQKGARAFGLDSGHYELHAAVVRAIDLPDAVVRWAAGEAVFASCPRVGSDRLS